MPPSPFTHTHTHPKPHTSTASIILHFFHAKCNLRFTRTPNLHFIGRQASRAMANEKKKRARCVCNGNDREHQANRIFCKSSAAIRDRFASSEHTPIGRPGALQITMHEWIYLVVKATSMMTTTTCDMAWQRCEASPSPANNGNNKNYARKYYFIYDRTERFYLFVQFSHKCLSLAFNAMALVTCNICLTHPMEVERTQTDGRPHF